MTTPAPAQGRGAHGLAPLSAEVQRTRRLDLTASMLAAGVLAVIEMGGAIAKRGFDATDLEVALLTSGQSAGLISSFFIAHLAQGSRKLPLVVGPEALSGLLLLGVAILKPGYALAFVILHALAQMCLAMTTPARVTIYRLNYPSDRRGRIVGRIRQVQLILTAIAALALSVALDWNMGESDLVRVLGPSRLPPRTMVNFVVPALALVGLAGTFIFSRIRVQEGEGSVLPRGSLRATVRRFVRVYREDRDFRRFENFYFLFGFANIMTVPLTQIHAVEALHADYFELSLINVVLVQGFMAATMAFWGRQLDRYRPNALRGILNIIFSLDFLALALSPNLSWVYAGRVCRGIAMGGGSLLWLLGALYYARSKEDAPVYLGIHTVLTGFRWLTAPFAGVLLKHWCGEDARPVFFGSFLVIMLSAVLLILEDRKQAPRKPPDEEAMPAPRPTGA